MTLGKPLLIWELKQSQYERFSFFSQSISISQLFGTGWRAHGNMSSHSLWVNQVDSKRKQPMGLYEDLQNEF